MQAATTTTTREGGTIVPRWMVAAIVAILTLLLTADVGAQFIPALQHTASPVLDGILLSILGGVIAGSRGPKPEAPDLPPPPADTTPRHRAPEEGP